MSTGIWELRRNHENEFEMKLIPANLSRKEVPSIHSTVFDPTINLHETTGFFGKAVYWLTRPLAIGTFYRLSYPCLLNLVGLRSSVEQCKEFLQDIGGEALTIETEDGAKLDAMYFDPEKFREVHAEAFTKWKEKFSRQEFLKTAEILEVDLQGENLATLMGLPNEIQEIQDHITGITWCMGAGNIYEYDPQAALMYLIRGKHVLLFNYRGIMKSKGSPDGKTTCLDAVTACLWLKDRLGCPNDNLCVHGKSMGTGPAAYAGTQLEGMDVIIDRGFCRMNEVINSKMPIVLRGFKLLTSYAVEQFYSYPNEDLIPMIKGRVLIMEAINDKIMEAFHAERLFEALVKSKMKEVKEKNKVEEFTQKYWIKAVGTHSSISGGDEDYSWYRDKQTQLKLSEFLIKN